MLMMVVDFWLHWAAHWTVDHMGDAKTLLAVAGHYAEKLGV